MSDFLDRLANLSAKRLALLAAQQHDEIEATRQRACEPIAIVGVGCRFPGGADDPARFWSMLEQGVDGICEVPADRWSIDAWFDPDPDRPGRMSARAGGFLSGVDQFDPAFFGIAPREALSMDPQQRMLLEVSWEALERAGIAPDSLHGSATGVFVGICNSDHFHRLLQRGSESIDAYLASGSAHSVAAGRISYTLGLQGPALSIDTACSSSLVALHQACRSLRSGESSLALAGGVNLMSSPETTIALSKAHMLAPDGRCKTFDAAADGFSRGEGCGMLVLKRLGDAQASGDRILALIRGSAVNQDGRSGGLTVPNGPAQEAVIRAALKDGGLSADAIDYVEAHGTGTSLGDPIEVKALAGAYGAGRRIDDPLWVGSVKTNIGHLESAAGVAGVIKVVLALQQEQLPPHLHFREPSPHIDWERYPVRVAAQGRPWPRGSRPRRAGVSSFGFSGTNAHLILEEAAAGADVAGPDRRSMHCLPLSARSGPALAALCDAAAGALSAERAPRFADAAGTFGAGRAHFTERLAVVATDAAVATEALTAAAAGREHASLHRGTAVPGSAPEVVFLFTGQGAQYPGMARALYDGTAVFRDIVDQADRQLGADADGLTLKRVLFDDDGGTRIHETRWTQPALFAVEYGLARLWMSWGIEPAAVIGHSVGEYVAACVAGVFDFKAGLDLVAERGRLMGALPPGGAMAAVFAGEDVIAAAIGPLADRLSIAAVNGPDNVVVSGSRDAVDALLAILAARDIQGQRLFISIAAHSPLVVPALEPMRLCASRVAMAAPRLPVAWNLTGGKPLVGGAPDADYWTRHLREPVRFAEGLGELHAQGYRTFLEVGPHPTLLSFARQALPGPGLELLTSLRRGKDDWAEMLTSLAHLYVRGAAVDWWAVNRGGDIHPVLLPTYPFERRSFWLEASPPKAARPTRADAAPRDAWSVERLATALPAFQSTLAAGQPSYLEQHRVLGHTLCAGSVLLELLFRSARAAFGDRPRHLEDFAMHAPLLLSAGGSVVQVQWLPTDHGDGEARPFQIHARPVSDAGDGAWTLHASGRFADRGAVQPSPASYAASAATTSATSAATMSAVVDLAALGAAIGPEMSSDAHYARLEAIGIELGPVFRTLAGGRRSDGEALACVALGDTAPLPDAALGHPALLDGVFQAIGLGVPASADEDGLLLISGIGSLHLGAPLPDRFWCHVSLDRAQVSRPATRTANVTIYDEGGGRLGELRGVELRRTSPDSLRRALAAQPAVTAPATPAEDSLENLFHGIDWIPIRSSAPAASSFGAPTRLRAAVEDAFAALASSQGLAVYDALLPELDRLAVDHVCTALRALGFDDGPGRRFTAAQESGRLAIEGRHHRLFGRLLEMLAEEGILGDLVPGAGPTSFVVQRRLPPAAPANRYETLLGRFGAVNGELLTLQRCGPALASVLQGRTDPVALLFPGGSLAEARQLYVDSPYARTYNRALAEALQRSIGAPGREARLRVLEIGAGTGGTTSYVLPLLAGHDVEYTFTDLSPHFLDQAAERFAAYPFIRRGLFDIERPPGEQGFAAGSFDVIIAANVLHAVRDLDAACGSLARLLAPGGLMYLLEGTAPERWVDLTFGMTEGWWRFDDRIRDAGYPLIDRARWLELLADNGLHESVACPAQPSSRAARQQALIVAQRPRLPRRFRLIGGRGESGISAQLAAALRARGDEVTVVDATAASAPATDSAPTEASAATTANAPGTASAPTGVEQVFLEACDVAAIGSDVAAARASANAAEALLATMEALAAPGADGRLWLVSRAAQAVDGERRSGARWQAPLLGLARGFALEQPDRWAGQVDLAADDDGIARLLRSLDVFDDEDQTAWRGDRRLAARLRPVAVPPATPVAFRADATYLVTGGFGGLGLELAAWMARSGARHIALLGRNPPAGRETFAAIEAAGARVLPIRADVADATALADAIALLSRDAPPLRGVIHAAAALSAAPIGRLGAARLREMLRPKVDGTVALQRATANAGLDFLVLFSSTTALLGASGLAHYAAANAFLDATAHGFDAPDRRVISVDWGTWDTMRLASDDDRRAYLAGGLRPMATSLALEALGRLLGTDRPQTVVAAVDWAALRALHESRRRRPLLESLGVAASAATTAAQGAAVATAGLMTRLARLQSTQRLDALVDFVESQVVAVLGLDRGSPVALDTGLFDLGMDSLMAVELKRRLEQGVGLPLPSTLTFNYPNVRALAGFLDRSVRPTLPGAVEPGSGAGSGRAATAGGAAAVAPSAPAVEAERAAASLDADLDSLTEEELEARLMARLERTR